jgi:hypothetical protein
MADVAVQPVPDQAENTQRWSLARRVFFRFAACYWLLYSLPEPGHVDIFRPIPGGQFVFKPYINLWHVIVPWVATHIFHVTGRAATYIQTGSGDTTLRYIQNLLFILLALAATLIWSILDRRRPDYRTLHIWLRLLVRYTLAFTLFSYGFAKVFPLQFQPPALTRLLEPYGEFSPMGVLWSFMGASIPYTILSGAAEVTAGLLLLFRRTKTLGAMAAFAVLLNVAALNFCYDVPVKLYSTNLVLMALFLAAADFGRLLNLFVLNRPAAPADLTGTRFPSRWMRIAATVFWVLFVGNALYGNISGGWKGYRSTYISPRRPLLYGIWDVESGPPNWRRVVVDFPIFLSVRTRDDKAMGYSTEYRDDTITLNKKDQLRLSRPDPDHVVLQGTLNGSPATIGLRKVDLNKFLLLNRGFHWISEVPFNR